MFTFLSRFRRQTAVLTALALVASVLVAVPVSAADDPPKPSYEATFSACVGEAEDSQGFMDVQAADAGRADIDCIGYYGITMGTGDGSTYSPLMSVTREHMALFLIRLAKVVGIEMASDPADPGFTDIGDLGDESQTAIAQLKALEITRGNNSSGTTYGPADPVTRGQMALFIARLMNQMAPMSNGGADTMADWGYTPDDVKKNKVQDDGKAREVLSPFTDLERVTKETFDSITWLYELGVASGSHGSPTQYSPFQQITRRSMAQFMAGVLHHSNARPAGLTIQATGIEPFGSYTPTIVVSYRTEMFQPVADTSIAVFDSVGEFLDDGTCPTGTDCDWSDDEYLTGASGNNSDHTAGEVSAGDENTYYAWIGDEETTKFDLDNGLHKTITLTAAHDATAIKVTSDINPNSTGPAKHSDKARETVNLDRDSSVTYTVQLIDAGGDPVHKEGVEITVMLTETPGDGTEGDSDADFAATASYSASSQEVLETDSKGQATFTTRNGPKSTGTGAANDDSPRYDTITFSSDVDGSGGDLVNTQTGENAGKPDEVVVKQLIWTDAPPVLSHAKAEADKFVIRRGDGKVRVRASVTYYDQYGNPAAIGETVSITIGGDAQDRKVQTRGTAGYTRTFETTGNVEVSIGNLSADLDGDGTDETVDGPTVPNVLLVVPANSGTITDADGEDVVAVYDGNRFVLTFGTPATANLYTYDSDDIFVIDGTRHTGSDGVDAFEKAIKATDTSGDLNADVQVIVYNTKGSSIFRAIPGT